MRTFPEKFREILMGGAGVPSIIVDVQETVLEQEVSTQAQWQANTGASNVDLAASPGDVVLTTQVTNYTMGFTNVSSANGTIDIQVYEVWQSFRNVTGLPRQLNKIANIYLTLLLSPGASRMATVKIFTETKSQQLGETKTIPVIAYGGWYEANFQLDGIILQNSSTYWMQIVQPGPNDGGQQIKWGTSTNSSMYTNGQVDTFHIASSSWTYNVGDALFEIYMSGDYKSPGYVATPTMDLGAVPDADGEFVAGDAWPGSSFVLYGGLGSDTGSFQGEEVPLYTATSSVWQQWTEVACGATRRQVLSAIVHNGEMFVFGGYSYQASYLNDLWKYNISSNQWTEVACGATRRYSHSMAVHNGEMFVFGGYSWQNSYLNDLWKYNISSNQWTEVACGATRRYSHSVAVHNGEMFVFGGFSYQNSRLNDLWKYNISSNMWTEVACGATGRYSHSAAIYNGEMFVFGGISFQSSTLNDLWKYNISSNMWTEVACGATRRYDHSAVVYNGEMFVFGGESYLNDLWKYNISSNMWTEVACGATRRNNHGSIIYNGDMYVFGGFSFQNSYLNDLWRYSRFPMIQDGDVIPQRHRFNRVKAYLWSNSDNTSNPSLKDVMLDYGRYRTYADRGGLGWEAVVKDVSALSAKIDDFDPSEVDQITVRMQKTPNVDLWLSTMHPKNKTVKIRAGFVAEGFGKADYVPYFFGQVANWDIEDGVVSVQVKSFNKSWDADVPPYWTASADNVWWVNSHHCDVITTLLRDKIGMRSANIEQDSILSVKEQTPNWAVSRLITGNSEKAGEMAEELRRLLNCWFIQTPDGRTKLKRFNPAEPVVASLSDEDLLGITFDANAEEVVNRHTLYYGWNGSGDNAENYLALHTWDGSDSQVQDREIDAYELKDKWTSATSQGKVQISEHSALLQRYEDYPWRVEVKLDRRWMGLENGDPVWLRSWTLPSSDRDQRTARRFYVVRGELDFIGDTVALELRPAD